MRDDIFKEDAKRIVDTAFDASLFNDKMTRDNMKIFEDLICSLMQSRFDGYVSTQEFLKKISKQC